MHARQYCIKKPLFTYQRCLNNCQCLSNSQNLFLTRQSSRANSASSLRSSKLLNVSVFCIFAVTKILSFVIIYSSTGSDRYELWSSYFVNQLSLSLALHTEASCNPCQSLLSISQSSKIIWGSPSWALLLFHWTLSEVRSSKLKGNQHHTQTLPRTKRGLPSRGKERRGGSCSPVILGGRVNLAA